MTFTVTYRGADGAMREERVEAANRGECFAQMKVRGIVPMSVKEGDSVSRRGRGGRRGEDGGRPRRDTSDRGGRKGKGQPARRRMVAFVLSVALVALIGGGVWWWLGRVEAKPSDKPEAPKKAALAKEVKPADAPKPLEVPESKPNVSIGADKIVLPNGIVTNRPKTLAEASRMILLKPGIHRYKDVDEFLADTNSWQMTKPKDTTLRTTTEHTLSIMAGVDPRELIPPMPPLPADIERDFRKSLDNMIAIHDDDSVSTAQMKTRVAVMKNEVERLIRQEGMTVGEALKRIEQEHNRKANLFQSARTEYFKILRTGDAEVAEGFRRDVNAVLDREGMPEINKEER